MQEYVSCQFVENTLLFTPNSILHCCISVNDRHGGVPVCEFDGHNFSAEKLHASQNKRRAIFADKELLTNSYCSGCSFIDSKKWEQRITNISIAPSFLCNLSCNYCNQSSILNKRPLYTGRELVNLLVKHDLLYDGIQIMYGGGEPMLHLEDFEYAVSKLMDTGAVVGLVSNSTIYSNVVCDYMAKGKPINILTSLDCGTPEMYKAKKGKDYFFNVLENLSTYTAANGNVAVKYILCDDNKQTSELDQFVKMLAIYELRCCHIDIDLFVGGRLTQDYIDAAVYLAKKLEGNGIEYIIGSHGGASVPEFKSRVEAILNY